MGKDLTQPVIRVSAVGMFDQYLLELADGDSIVREGYIPSYVGKLLN